MSSFSENTDGENPERENPERPINPIVRFSVERRVTMSMVVVGLLVMGWLSLKRLPLEFLPTFSSSSISVNVPYPSASPEEVERLLVRPLEDVLGTINGIDTLQASSSANSGNVNLSFIDGTDMEMAAVDVRDRIDRVRNDLPADVERINIRRFQSTDIPVLRTSLSTPWDRDLTYEFVDETLRPRLERLEGVAQVGIWGLETRELQVNLNPVRMNAARIDVRQLATALRTNNINISGGYVEEGSRRLLVRTVGELATPDQIRRLPIRGDGLRLGDVADIAYDYPQRESFNYLNGQPALYISINKASTANLLAVVERVKVEYQAIQQEHPELTLRHFHDASVDVSQGLSELSKAGLIGGGLAVVFMFLFLRKFRTTLLIAIAIPLSLITTFVFIYLGRQAHLTEMTLNVMSLMGLMLAVGMLLDNSIVVIESIYRHRQELGEDARTATLRGASEVAMPIIASTATTMCVFLPILFVSKGGFTRYMGDMGMTVCIVMVASLLVSLTVVPMAAVVLLRSETRSKPRLLEKMIDGYGAAVRFTIHHRLAFAVLIVGLLFGSWKLYTGIARTFSPPSEGRQVDFFVDLPKRFSIEQRKQVFEDVYTLLDAKREEWEIADIAYEVRRGSGRGRSKGMGGSNRFEIYLKPEEVSKLRTSEVQNRLREAFPDRAGVTFKIAQAQQHGPGDGGGGINVELIGDDLAVLELLSPQITSRLRELPFLKDIDTSLESGGDEIRVSVNRERALQAGLSTQGIAQTVASALSSRSLSYFKTDDREIGVVMQYREQDRETLDQLRKMPVFVDDVQLPIDALADFEVTSGARTIERENRRSKIAVTANVLGDMPSFAAMGAVQRALSTIGLPPGYEWRFGRSFRDAQQDASGAGFALFFAMVLIYMIMAALFENFVQPFTIMLSIPFAFIGVGLIMKIANQPRSSAADMGLIILAGIVVNNAIVLIDHINHLRAQGLRRDEAVVLGGKHRLRPILMTAVTTILGLSPMVAPFFLPQYFGQPQGRAAMWAPISLVILGGLTTSTFLTLLVIPTVYTLVDDFTCFLRRIVLAVQPSSLPLPQPQQE